MGRIPQNFIDEVLNRVDIVEIVDARVPLKKAGREYTACCPFHDEKTPSFTVSPSKQFYHCFGCGAHGTAVGFLMEYEHQNFPEAIESLAQHLGLEVPREDDAGGESTPRVDTSPLFELLARSDTFFRRQLRSHPQAQRAVDYLKTRGLSGEIAAEFGIGYAPPGWDNLQTALGESDQLREQLVTVGMLIRKDDDRTYDRFRDRIMFPIRDRRGRTIAFGGRILDPPAGPDTSGRAAEQKPRANEPKYLNSPETPVFHKGRELYGLFEARKALRQIPRLLVVEGYMDVVSLAQFGVRYAVATLGTATTREHLNHLFRVTPEIVFCFDGDRAGREAAWRALDNALPVMREGYELRFMFLPEGADPDTRIRDIGREAFENEIGTARPFSEFFFDSLSREIDLTSIDGRARLVQQARPLLERMPKGVFQQMMRQRLGELAQLDPQQLRDPTAATPHGTRSGRPAPRSQRQGSRTLSPLRFVITALLSAPELAREAGETTRLTEIQLPGADLLRQILGILADNPDMRSGALLARFEGTDAWPHMAKLAAGEQLVTGEELATQFRANLQHIEDQWLESLREQVPASMLSSLSIEQRRLLNAPLPDLSAEQKIALRGLLPGLTDLPTKT